MTDTTVYFLITSYGRTASYWIASALHRHPDIICSHGPAMPPMMPRDAENEPSQSEVIRAHRDLDAFYRTPLDDFFDAMETLGSAKVYGNAHAYAAQSVQALLAASRRGRTVAVINIVRHPVGRIESFRRRFEYELTYNPYFQQKVHAYIEQAVPSELLNFAQARCKGGLAQQDRLFLYALSLVASHDQQDLRVPVPHLPMERLIAESGLFAWMFERLTHGRLQADGEYLAEVYARGRLNALAPQKSPALQYQQWQPWMREALRLVMDRYDFTKMYEPFRYDFSFARGT